MLAVPRNIDVMPVGGVELLGSVIGSIPNDGVFHALAEPAGLPPLNVAPLHRTRVGFIRVEWQVLDLSQPPPLALRVLVNGQTSVGANSLAFISLQALAVGPPALELDVHAEIEPGATVQVFCRNTGVVNPQIVTAYLWGWAFSQTLTDGESYGA